MLTTAHKEDLYFYRIQIISHRNRNQGGGGAIFIVSLDERETLAFTGQEDPAGPKERGRWRGLNGTPRSQQAEQGHRKPSRQAGKPYNNHHGDKHPVIWPWYAVAVIRRQLFEAQSHSAVSGNRTNTRITAYS